MEADRSRKVGWQFWLAWVLASAVGFLVGMVAGVYMAWSGDKPEPLAWAIFTFLIGAGGGTGQWLVLRWRLPRTGWWIPATAVGSMVGGIAVALSDQAVAPFSGMAPEIAFIAVGGVTCGTLQWLVLRNRVAKGGWWIATSVVGAWLAVTMAAWNFELLAESQRYIVAGTVLGIGFGVIQGVVLVWLMRLPARDTTRAVATA